MRRSLLSILTLGFCLPAAAALWNAQDFSDLFAASAAPNSLLRGCSDVPEAVALADELASRARGIERYMAALDLKQKTLTTSESALRKALAELKTGKSKERGTHDGSTAAVRDDVDRLVALYDQMKPTEAAAVIAKLPADFAAEILMRVRPENGARIIAAVEPSQAALLTAQMGARSIRHK